LTLQEHVRSHTSELMRRLSVQVRKASGAADEESVHDLRVAIRRLRECLRTFADLFPAAPRKLVRKQLRKLMKFAERVRSADIALELMKKAKLEEDAPEVTTLREQRATDQATLRKELKAFSRRPYTRTWSKALGL